jgi:triosephosphate isomerase
MRKYVIGGNWKMQIPKISDSISTAAEIANELNKYDVEVFISPSYNSLYPVSEKLKGSSLKLAAQNMAAKETGAFTGEISVLSLIELGVEYVLLGHSERRRIFNESNELINEKVHLALKHGLKVVLCIGETAKERSDGLMKKINQDQLEYSLKDIGTDQMNNVIIAYEPVWAINSPYLNPGIEIRPATIEEANDSHTVVRNWLQDSYGSIANSVRIQYGGSMKASNAEELLSQSDIDGGLIGGACLNAESFAEIVKASLS